MDIWHTSMMANVQYNNRIESITYLNKYLLFVVKLKIYFTGNNNNNNNINDIIKQTKQYPNNISILAFLR